MNLSLVNTYNALSCSIQVTYQASLYIYHLRALKCCGGAKCCGGYGGATLMPAISTLLVLMQLISAFHVTVSSIRVCLFRSTII